jgi:hypothetical protein
MSWVANVMTSVDMDDTENAEALSEWLRTVEQRSSNDLAVPNPLVGHRETYQHTIRENPAYRPARPLPTL